MENLLFLGVPILKHIRVAEFANTLDLMFFNIQGLTYALLPIKWTQANSADLNQMSRSTRFA